eukprot:2903768-Pleurochrysis_carterae.AAC.1
MDPSCVAHGKGKVVSASLSSCLGHKHSIMRALLLVQSINAFYRLRSHHILCAIRGGASTTINASFRPLNYNVKMHACSAAAETSAEFSSSE